jgi:hypothetical protein
MAATVFEIVEKVKTNPVGNPELGNFILREGETVPAQTVVQSNVSLYCLDDVTRRAVFVETPPEVDLSQAPFYYAAQYDHALRLFTLPYETFHQIADNVPVGKLIMLYSTGRCGSTLISAALGAVEGVVSLSEPDVFTQIHFMRFLDRSRDAEYTRLLASCVHMFSKGAPTLTLKFRGMCIQIGDLLYEAFPDAKNLFLYRNAETWARSMGLEMREVEERRSPVREFPIYRRSMATLSIPFAAEHGREATGVELSMLSWLSLMHKYVALYEAGMPFLALRYEDIREHPIAVLAAMFAYCGLDANVDQVYEVFGRDSQEGTVWSRESRKERPDYPLEDADYAAMRAVLGAHPVIQSADYIAPGILTFGDTSR